MANRTGMNFNIQSHDAFKEVHTHNGIPLMGGKLKESLLLPRFSPMSAFEKQERAEEEV